MNLHSNWFTWSLLLSKNSFSRSFFLSTYFLFLKKRDFLLLFTCWHYIQSFSTSLNLSFSRLHLIWIWKREISPNFLSMSCFSTAFFLSKKPFEWNRKDVQRSRLVVMQLVLPPPFFHMFCPLVVIYHLRKQEQIYTLSKSKFNLT